MKMQIEVEVSGPEHAAALQIGLSDPAMVALAVTSGLLNPLTPRARERVLRYVCDRLADEALRPAEVAATVEEAERD